MVFYGQDLIQNYGDDDDDDGDGGGGNTGVTNYNMPPKKINYVFSTKKNQQWK